MFNQELIKLYASQQSNVQLMNDVQFTDIIKALNNHFQSWTWELISDTVITDGTGNNLLTTVALYTPGRLCTGRSYCKVKDAADNHLRALYNASLVFIDKSNSGINNTPQNNTAIQPQQMTVDQINAMANGNNGKFINSSNDFANYTDEKGMPVNSVPMDAISEQGYQEVSGFDPYNPMEQYNATQTQQPQEQRQQQVQPNRNYTQEQLNGIKKFKEDFGILDDSMFNNWVNAWHKGWTKGALTPENIDDFLAFTRQRGEGLS